MIKVSDSAASRAKAVLEQRGRPDGALRVFVAGGGCSGPQFGMALAEAAESDDTELQFGGVRFLVDAQSAPYLEGAEIDYVDEEVRSGFTIFNPALQSQGGGCGSGGCACGR
jgi:iron-sulfur cluster assembly accessory protein